MTIWQASLRFLDALLVLLQTIVGYLAARGVPARVTIAVGFPSVKSPQTGVNMANNVLNSNQTCPLTLQFADTLGAPVPAPVGAVAAWNSSDLSILSVASDPANSLAAVVGTTGKTSVPGTPVVITVVVTLASGTTLPSATASFDVVTGGVGGGGAPASVTIVVGTAVP